MSGEYGYCPKHGLPLEVLFNVARCSLCEDQRREAAEREEQERERKCHGGCDGCRCGNE